MPSKSIGQAQGFGAINTTSSEASKECRWILQNQQARKIWTSPPKGNPYQMLKEHKITIIYLSNALEIYGLNVYIILMWFITLRNLLGLLW